ncbi:Panacea domain-containing protein [Alteribacter natronophilus]|uniref:Panacea domain-containing protein n=1 Tax=Alteribacter natronophilus TaxID=2583810 RepID=UPI00110E5E40|nr:type II toxin-antitoxin system antitoxin SocA domain-containing protein [Alteribacter natronophilus]TMW70948.1 DUF4065 domain-containing protein [Alteribacter natronophilus]
MKRYPASFRPEIIETKTALEVSRVLLSSPRGMNLLRLQNLLYFAQGYHLALHNRPLFSDPIEARDFGVLVQSVLQSYIKYGRDPLPRTAKKDVPALSKEERAILNAVVQIAHEADPHVMQRLICSQKPWIEARKKVKRWPLSLVWKDVPEISHDLLIEEFTKRNKKEGLPLP